MARYIVTGATSFIGGAVVKQLLRANNEVFVVIRPTSTKKDAFCGLDRCTSVLIDLDDINQIIQVVDTADFFIHLGWDGIAAKGRSNPVIQEKNVKLAENCLRVAAELHCHSFLFAGSQAEYGLKNEVIHEYTICEPVTEYGKGKLRVLNNLMPLAQELGINYYHSRIFSVYGPNDHPWTLVSSSINTFIHGEEFKASSGDQLWNFMYIDDAAGALVSLIESNAPSGIYNVASNDTRPLKDFIGEIYKCCGGKGILSLGAYTPVEKTYNLHPDISKISSVIGNQQFTDFSDGINMIIKENVE